ncbi:MAG: 1-deoxy-D-xylulose-5-phosphate reductoisomerase [Clostridia bacterium]|nr:1-deoxy-D-xylulose-5-phosphate reductoisomerase [Clostridia bacterium]
MTPNEQYPDLIILGSTGSVGTQAADVARSQGIRVRGLSANRNVDTVEAQARRFRPDYAVMTDPEAAKDLRVKLADTGIKVLSGFEGITEMIRETGTDNPHGITVENSILGSAGLVPTLETLKAGHRLALANKESMVVGGELVTALAGAAGAEILPVDSEHCAIFQCLRAGRREEIKKILLTASGGPFFGYTKEQLNGVTKAMTLAHPTWKMGAKITVDSATLMNKGFEVIEAVHLFGVRPEQIQVVVHRESMIHSMVEYTDHSIIAQLSVPDMRHCVQYALTHPSRLPAGDVLGELDLFSVGKLTFSPPDTDTFPLLALAVDCIKAGGALPAALNAANEVVVAAFLADKLRFCEIPETVTRVVEDMRQVSAWHSYEQIMAADRLARRSAEALIRMRGV